MRHATYKIHNLQTSLASQQHTNWLLNKEIAALQNEKLVLLQVRRRLAAAGACNREKLNCFSVATPLKVWRPCEPIIHLVATEVVMSARLLICGQAIK